ncbi:helix-turn-helix transcriptional regulator [Micromonospora costi]|uniref:helix-turn-helix transcriptional regulator n=1 Tax=Micromonospora costi TaxID=1530042 RepID=UPI0016521FE6|nr:helix-turn-helix transcriptional regulator [Micromonospora costi]
MNGGEQGTENPLVRLGRLIREARADLGWTQDELADASGVSRPTIQRYENAKVPAPEFDKVRAIVQALKVDAREVPVALGIVTRDEMGLPPERVRTRRFDATTEDILVMLEDPRYTDAEKLALRELLRAQLAGRPGPGGQSSAEAV